MGVHTHTPNTHAHTQTHTHIHTQTQTHPHTHTINKQPPGQDMGVVYLDHVSMGSPSDRELN